MAAGIMPSVPEYDDGIDLIASLERSGRYVARSIQITALTDLALMTDREYRTRPGLLVVHVDGRQRRP